jgi:hypothetical protein
MARFSAEPSGIDRWLFRLGYASSRIGNIVQHVRNTASGVTDTVRGAAGEMDDAWSDASEPTREQVRALAATTAAGALLAQLFRPHSVNWPRAVLAGTIGTLMYDAETLVTERLSDRKFGTRAPARSTLLSGGARETALRYAAGIAMAGFYARYLYGRLPVPPLAQGVAYGLLESGTRGWGGAVALLNRLSPEIGIPTAYTQGLGRPGDDPLRAIRGHLAFGIALGVIYRGKKGK